MRYLELRRHTLRDKDSPHISQEGLDLARRVGLSMGPFVRVVCSPAPRCIETAVAMGFAVNDLYVPVQEEMKKKRVAELEELLPFEFKFLQREKVLRENKAARKYALALLEQWSDLARATPVGKTTLVLTHGGYLEDSAMACLPAADHRKWGENFAPCEGIRLSFVRGYFSAGRLLRM